MQVPGKFLRGFLGFFSRPLKEGVMREAPQALKPVTVTDLLPDIDGGEHNLLPVRATRRPLPISIPMWLVSDPSDEGPERLVVKWDGQPFVDKTWTTPVQPADLELEVPVALLGEGRHTLMYQVTLGNEESTVSDELSVLIDKTAPVPGGGRGRLELVEDPDEVERDGLTARYLERHADRLRTRVPTYDSPAVGDVITVYWGDKPDDSEQVGSLTLTQNDVLLPIHIDFQGEMIRQSGDGVRYAYYEIEDRAGNLSNLARSLELDVRAQPAPRQFDWVEIAQATGASGDLALKLDDYIEPLLVAVPMSAQWFPDETVTVIWGEPEDYGYYTTSEVHPGTERAYAIPERHVLAYAKKTLVVRYEVRDDADVFPSAVSHLKVTEFSKSGLPMLALEGADSNGFSLGSAPERVPVSLGTWRGIAVEQQVNISVGGVLQSGLEAPPQAVLTAHPLTPAQVSRGIGANKEVTVPKAYLATLKRNEPFTFLVQVSFDGGGTWVDFPRYSPTLRA
ncbi:MULTISPECIES: hypothetical protein [Pseudomonas]|nr:MULTISPECIES: hypothetical protein [Pseudomonas]MBA6137878.1 hypothetical protein [Pseudomonas monteilii]MCA4076211.1 hypothetical protein [Pseudomonas kurunegalensis]MDT3747082.1 hypothetical protein [Pseudomonas kurunegalensis]